MVGEINLGFPAEQRAYLLLGRGCQGVSPGDSAVKTGRKSVPPWKGNRSFPSAGTGRMNAQGKESMAHSGRDCGSLECRGVGEGSVQWWREESALDANDSGAFKLYFLKLPLSFRFQREKFVNLNLKDEKCMPLGNSSRPSEQVNIKVSYNPQRKVYHLQSWSWR